MEIYVMRHGTTIWNEKGITQGRSNNHLSKDGKKLAISQSEKYKNTHFDVIYSSPLTRTFQTAKIMNQFHNSKIIKCDLLNEIDQGIFTGRKFSSLTEEEKLLKSTKAPETKMENIEQVFERVLKFLDIIKSKHQNQTLLIVTHNITASLIELALSNGNIFDESFKSNCKLFQNAEIKKFKI